MKTIMAHKLKLSSLFAVTLWWRLVFSVAVKCPQATPNWGSGRGGEKATAKITNASPIPIAVYWVDFNGEDGGGNFRPTEIYPGAFDSIETYTNHHFRIYGKIRAQEKRMLLLEEYVVQKKNDRLRVLGDCDDVTVALEEQNEHQKEMRKETEKEMEALVHDQNAPCLPQDDSRQWSCIRHITKQEYDERLAQNLGTVYGFNSTQESGNRDIDDVVDRKLDGVIGKIPRLTTSKGFLKMSFTDKMKEVLLPFYESHKRGGPQDSVEEHAVIPGGYTNSHTVKMSKLNLDRFPEIHNQVKSEIQRILEWWTGRPLAHTSTFGIRIYHRDSMLINHVDRPDTHLASAVIQVAQEGVDQGWPLEVMHPDNGSCDEVYLQPGELVLYEGARFRHGRPMRFNGTDFANIFSHFRPLDWHGPGKSPNYDGLLDKDGYLISKDEHGGEL